MKIELYNLKASSRNILADEIKKEQDEKCPVCHKSTCHLYYGEYEGFHKATPDCVVCNNCGFYTSENIKSPLSEQVKKYKKVLKDKRASNVNRRI